MAWRHGGAPPREDARERQRARRCGAVAAGLGVAAVVGGALLWWTSSYEASSAGVRAAFDERARAYRSVYVERFERTRWLLRVGEGGETELDKVEEDEADRFLQGSLHSGARGGDVDSASVRFATGDAALLPPPAALEAARAEGPAAAAAASRAHFNVSIIAEAPGGRRSELLIGSHAAVSEQAFKVGSWKNCEYQMSGAYVGGQCRVYKRLASICVKVAWDAAREAWSLDGGGGGRGCSPRTSFAPVTRATIAPTKAQAALDAPIGALTVREAHDPLIAALNLTHGEHRIFAEDEAEREATGIVLLVVGAVLLVPAAVLLWPEGGGRHGQRRYERFAELV